ncbi:MAG: 50S ribosomal protein L11 methyltransferase [Bdellovibrionales bacterium]
MYTVRLKLPATITNDKVPHFAELFDSVGFSAARLNEKNQNDHTAPWVLEWICEFAPNLDHVTDALSIILNANNLASIAGDFYIEKTPDIDWLSHSYQAFPAFEVGPFFIYGSHYDGDLPKDKLGLQIDAATAFGSGEHGTTAGCIEAMEWLEAQGLCPWHVLDMGTGSGILAIAAWKLWKTPVLAVDNDAAAVRVAEHHRVLNNVPDGKMNILCEVGDGFAADIVQQRRPYELVIANILAGPLKEMAADLCAVLDDGGRVILSGILNEQADSVREAYEGQGMAVLKEIKLDGWTSFILSA